MTEVVQKIKWRQRLHVLSYITFWDAWVKKQNVFNTSHVGTVQLFRWVVFQIVDVRTLIIMYIIYWSYLFSFSNFNQKMIHVFMPKIQKQITLSKNSCWINNLWKQTKKIFCNTGSIISLNDGISIDNVDS